MSRRRRRQWSDETIPASQRVAANRVRYQKLHGGAARAPLTAEQFQNAVGALEDARETFSDRPAGEKREV